VVQPRSLRGVSGRRAGNRAAGIHSLRQAAHAMARAVDAWEGREASALEPRA